MKDNPTVRRRYITYNSLGFDHRVTTQTYTGVHEWLNDHYPRAGRCECCGRTDRPTEYAVARPGFFTRNRADWFEFCRRCHRLYDGRPEVTPETRAKLRAASTGKTVSPETRAKLSAFNTGKKYSLERRAQMSAERKGKPQSPELVEKRAAANRGQKRTPETRAKLRAAWERRKAAANDREAKG
jgi:hypothetical protein